MEANQTTATGPCAVFAALAKVLAEVDAIAKGRQNQQQHYQFRGIDDVYNEIHPLFGKHGIFTSPEVLEFQQVEKPTKSGGAAIWTTVKVRFRFFAGDGSFFDAVTVGEAMDTGDKSAGKAQSYAHKVALLQVLAIPTEGDHDTENKSYEIERSQPRAIRTKASAPQLGAAPAPSGQSSEPAGPAELTEDQVKAILADPRICWAFDKLQAGLAKRVATIQKHGNVNAVAAALTPLLEAKGLTWADRTKTPEPAAAPPAKLNGAHPTARAPSGHQGPTVSDDFAF